VIAPLDTFVIGRTAAAVRRKTAHLKKHLPALLSSSELKPLGERLSLGDRSVSDIAMVRELPAP